ncbi:hypothetical protein [Phenylobacterium sp.]|uniref:hypothetical protein n=1 Tax=Phenylobacterium sp. TaxID=1871053 RepID=UPI002BF000B2|nr:hypothetical protein [Phenylobacterium sp.]HLZ74477.1 hypothetical protein [Phenylobacterium sp.]
MKLRLAGLAVIAAMGVAHGAWADPEVMLKCGGALPDGMRFTAATGWQPFPNPDRGVTITREHNKYAIAVEGDLAFTSGAVFALPQVGIRSFKVLRSSGSEYFRVEKDPASGKPILKHTISGGRDGSGKYNIREMTLGACPTVSPDVVVTEPAAAGSTPEK